MSDLRARVKTITVHALERREFWAHQPGEAAVARAIAYQHVAGELINALNADKESED